MWLLRPIFVAGYCRDGVDMLAVNEHVLVVAADAFAFDGTACRSE